VAAPSPSHRRQQQRDGRRGAEHGAQSGPAPSRVPQGRAEQSQCQQRERDDQAVWIPDHLVEQGEEGGVAVPWERQLLVADDSREGQQVLTVVLQARPIEVGRRVSGAVVLHMSVAENEIQAGEAGVAEDSEVGVVGQQLE
jgi:hypothetical protein